MELTSVIYEKRGNAAHITLNRPDVFNAFDETQSYDLQAALKEANKDVEVRVVVLTGSGKAFCSGQDLKAIAGSKNRSLVIHCINDTIPSSRRCEKCLSPS